MLVLPSIYEIKKGVDRQSTLDEERLCGRILRGNTHPRNSAGAKLWDPD